MSEEYVLIQLAEAACGANGMLWQQAYHCSVRVTQRTSKQWINDPSSFGQNEQHHFLPIAAPLYMAWMIWKGPRP
ncbi:hypothetical protein [Pseudomonas donghuensis]|uniref:Uncharacterized protein n=1 Tax=Pseudomonas donghuensis TaxID=1163398 RepID=A0AAQ0IQD7_9PSED|nr:hypothetical protein [Pseudomonas donghuensis]MCP6691299.1 hypothetical protein [Pseudomonas donghuensis]MDF9893402.1 hypothetical protein [Pseudomonas vranovensis]QWE81272.1 hypothetical protein BV82_13130 [Pseudomonas donghuensis]